MSIYETSVGGYRYQVHPVGSRYMLSRFHICSDSVDRGLFNDAQEAIAEADRLRLTDKQHYELLLGCELTERHDQAIRNFCEQALVPRSEESILQLLRERASE